VEAEGLDGGALSVSPKDLSHGTKEQLSFLFRLVLAEVLSGSEPQLMVLDDSFVNSDPQRFAGLIELIRAYAGKIQFLVFSCNEAGYFDIEKGDSLFHTCEILSKTPF
jgi:uncharacterized protein YhaN